MPLMGHGEVALVHPTPLAADILQPSHVDVSDGRNALQAPMGR